MPYAFQDPAAPKSLVERLPSRINVIVICWIEDDESLPQRVGVKEVSEYSSGVENLYAQTTYAPASAVRRRVRTAGVES